MRDNRDHTLGEIEFLSEASAEQVGKQQLSEEMSKTSKRDHDAVEKEKNEGGEPSNKK